MPEHTNDPELIRILFLCPSAFILLTNALVIRCFSNVILIVDLVELPVTNMSLSKLGFFLLYESENDGSLSITLKRLRLFNVSMENKK